MTEWNPILLSGLALIEDTEVLQTLQNQMLYHVHTYAFLQLLWYPVIHLYTVIRFKLTDSNFFGQFMQQSFSSDMASRQFLY
jgi:hypothetical protein